MIQPKAGAPAILVSRSAILARGDAALARSAGGEAALHFRQALIVDPASADGFFGLGNALWMQGDAERAGSAFGRALALDPADFQAHCNQGGIEAAQGRIPSAALCFRRALALAPALAQIHGNIGALRLEAGELDGAERALARAIRLAPGLAGLWNGLGNLRHDQGRRDEAEAAYRRAVILDGNNAKAYLNLGNLLAQTGRVAEAETSYRTAYRLDPRSGAALSGLIHQRRLVCDWSHEQTDRAALLAMLRQGATGISPFVLLSQDVGDADRQACARRWTAERSKGIVPLPAAPPPVPGRRLKIGYLSADLHDHPTAHLAAELFERHDRRQFELFAYSYGPDDGSLMRGRLLAAFDHFVEIGGLSHRAAAEAIRADEIAILVDLKGHTQDARPQILAYRPSPVQVSFLGYPGTMGSPDIDWIIADPVVLPPHMEAFYDEAVLRLPVTYQPNDRQRPIDPAPQDRARHGLPDQAFVFASFNNLYKLTPGLFGLWMDLLRAIEGSVLWILAENETARRNLRREAAAGGVDPDRLVFAGRLPPARHLARQRLADLFLDSLPYNAHTTASDALWAGLPVLTCLGDSFAGRVAGSLLKAIGLPELVTTSLEDYRALALALAQDPARLGRIRTTLDENRLKTPLFDSAGFVRAIEALYREMAGRAPGLEQIQ